MNLMNKIGSNSGARVGYRDLREYLALLEAKGLLRHIKPQVDPELEIGAITARSLARKGPALWFENVKGYGPDRPLVTNIISTNEQLAVVFNTEPDEDKILERVIEGMNERIPSVTLPTGACKEVIVTGDAIDLNMVPTPRWHEHDGGRYLGTTSGIVTRDPKTDILNMGSYRLMIKEKTSLSMTGGTRGK